MKNTKQRARNRAKEADEKGSTSHLWVCVCLRVCGGGGAKE